MPHLIITTCARRPQNRQQWFDYAPDPVSHRLNVLLIADEMGMTPDEVECRLQWLYRNEPKEEG